MLPVDLTNPGQVPPELVVAGKLIQAGVDDPQLPDLLKVGLGNAPGATQVLERTVGKEIGHRLPGRVMARSRVEWLTHKIRRLGIERGEDTTADLGKSELWRG